MIRRVLIASLTMALFGCAAPDQRAAMGGDRNAPVEGGIGGTGIVVAGQEGGIGGTGAPLTAAAAGTVTGFGSIHVNGLRVVFPQDGVTGIDGAAVQETDIDLGETVEIVGVKQADGTVLARSAFVAHAVTGRVRYASLDGRTLDVMGARIVVEPGATVVDSTGQAVVLQAGDRVAVSGLPREGVIYASRIERLAPDGPSGAFGVIEGLSIHGISVRPAVPGRSMLTGVPVWIEGVERDGVLVAQGVRRGLLASVETPVPDVSVEGYLEPASARAGYAIEGFAQPLDPGSKVSVLAGDRAIFIGSFENGAFRVRHGLRLPETVTARRNQLEAVENGFAPAGALETR